MITRRSLFKALAAIPLAAVVGKGITGTASEPALKEPAIPEPTAVEGMGFVPTYTVTTSSAGGDARWWYIRIAHLSSGPDA